MENNIKDKLSKIKNKIVVLSGKGGVGKSTVASNIAMSLASKGHKTGLLDVDIHGPSIPTIFGLENEKAQGSETSLLPITFGDNLKIISIGFLIDNPDDAIIWRGPAKAGVIQQFIKDVEWDELDYLIVDCPPGTGDEPLSVIQMLEDVTGAVIVTTPQKLAIADVRRSVSFCDKVKVPILGVIENMSGFFCPECNKTIEIFKSGGGEEMAKNMNIPFLGKIPLDPNVVEAGDSGQPFLSAYSETQTAKILEEIIKPITEKNTTKEEKNTMKFAIPTNNGNLCMHFGHCEVFTLIEINEETKEILNKEEVVPPPHEPGVLPPWLAEKGANIIIAGGMGARAQQLFAQQDIKVIVGAQSENPEEIVQKYLDNTLETGINACDH